MKKILLPTDFSINAKKAVDYAIQTFGQQDVEYHLLNVYSEPHTSADMLVSILDVLAKQSKEELNEEHDRILNDFPTFKAHVIFKSEYGSIINNIERLVKEEGYDFIVMGTKGASGIKKIFVGSNAADVIKHKVCPTIIVPETTMKSEIEKVLVGFDNFDFDDNSTFEPIASFVKDRDVLLRFAHVQEGQSDLTKYSNEIERKLSSYFKEIDYELVNIDNKDVVQGFAKYLKEEHIDLLIMIVRSHSFFERLFHQSMTQQMAMTSDTPLLIVHEK